MKNRSDNTRETGWMERMVGHITDLVVSVDRPAVIAHVRALHERYPEKDSRSIAKGLISRARWKATLLGAGSGLPSSPWTAVPAVAIDLAKLWKIEVNLAAHIAVLYDPHFFDDPEPPYELLVPLFGTRLISGLGGQVATRGAMVMSRLAIKRYLWLQTLRQVQRILLRYLGAYRLWQTQHHDASVLAWWKTKDVRKVLVKSHQDTCLTLTGLNECLVVGGA